MEAEKEVCKHYQRGLCSYGSRCRFLHIDPIQEEKQNSIVLLVADVINGYPVFGRFNGKVIGMDVPVQHSLRNYSSENYIKVLNYIISEGYKIISVVNDQEKMIIHFEKQVTTAHNSFDSPH
jgi:hypothetical protein